MTTTPPHAVVTVAALALHMAGAGDGAGHPAGAGGIARGGYIRACGGRGLLEGMAAAVGRLAEVLAAAEGRGVNYDAWARAVRKVSAALGCVQPMKPCHFGFQEYPDSLN